MGWRMWTAAILAGGQARRLGGQDKGALAVGAGSTTGGTPRSIRERQLAVLRSLTPHILIIGRDGISDRVPGAGALGGLYTALLESTTDRVLVVACDMPFLSQALLEHMARIDADVVIPRTMRGYEPLCAIYSRACIAPMRVRLTRGELEASRLLEGVRVAEVGPETLAAYDPNGLLFVNVNTPHDYERAKEVLEERSKTSRDRIMDELGP